MTLCEIQLINCKSFVKAYFLIERLTERHIRWADTVFISAMIVQKESFEEVVALCNRHGTPVVAGGPYATSCYQEISGFAHDTHGVFQDQVDFIQQAVIPSL
jgi:radical SAM superfamily enzyme YgiQ (UPF0313 family)